MIFSALECLSASQPIITYHSERTFFQITYRLFKKTAAYTKDAQYRVVQSVIKVTFIDKNCIIKIIC